MDNYDLIVVGGGISGVMAAVAASRLGVKTLIIEQYGFLGGMLTAAGVGPMMTFHAGDRQVIQGLTGELIDRLVSKGGSVGHIVDTTGYTYTVTPFDPEGMKRELEMILLEQGGEILFHTMLAGVAATDGIIRSVRVCNKAGLTDLTAKMYIDATGDADLSAWAGVECATGRENDGACQPMTMNLRMANVDLEQVKAYIKANPDQFPHLKGNTALLDQAPRLATGGFVKILKEAQKSGAITFPREFVLFFETNNPGEVVINTSRVTGYHSTDPQELSQAEVEGRRQAFELERFMKAKIPGFQQASLISTGPAIGVRSSRQIRGLYTLTAEDLLNCKRFEDVVAHGGYPIDIHNPSGAGTESKHLKWGDIYQIPYRSLVNGKVHNLITVGRSISASFEAQAAIRLSPIAGAIGHAGGVAAAITLKEGQSASEIKIASLQKTLRQQGAYLEG